MAAVGVGDGRQDHGLGHRHRREIAKALGVQLEIRDMRFAGLLEAVRKGDVDLAISAITWTSEREKVLEFSMPYYLAVHRSGD
jgi:ABC-type amino acid transport substrate-binding protein